jgi:hypothetical protein
MDRGINEGTRAAGRRVYAAKAVAGWTALAKVHEQDTNSGNTRNMPTPLEAQRCAPSATSAEGAHLRWPMPAPRAQPEHRSGPPARPEVFRGRRSEARWGIALAHSPWRQAHARSCAAAKASAGSLPAWARTARAWSQRPAAAKIEPGGRRPDAQLLVQGQKLPIRSFSKRRAFEIPVSRSPLLK